MKILFDQGTPVPLRRYLTGYSVSTAYIEGWSELLNGDLLQAAEDAAFDVFLTTDQNLKYQQNLAKRKIAVVVLLSTSWPKIQLRIEQIKQAVENLDVGDYVEIEI